MPIYLLMFYTFEQSYNTTDRQVKNVLNSGWNGRSRSSVLIRAALPSLLQYLDPDQCWDTEREKDLLTTET